MSSISLPDRTIASERVTPVLGSYHAPLDAPLDAARRTLGRLEPLDRAAARRRQGHAELGPAIEDQTRRIAKACKDADDEDWLAEQ